MNDSSRTLYILRGLPGSGKSTLGRKLAPNSNVAADDFMVNEEGVFTYDVTRIKEVHEKCQAQVLSWLREKVPVIAVHNTASRFWEFEPYIKMANEHEYSPIVLECQNAWGSVHGVPEVFMDKLADQWEGTPVFHSRRKT